MFSLFSSKPSMLNTPLTNERESNTLAVAILAGDIDQVRMLIDMGITISECHHWVLYEACLQGMDMVQLLLTTQNVDFNVMIPNSGGDPLLCLLLRTPSSRFASNGKMDVVAQLLNSGVNPLLLDRLGDTIIHVAAGMGPDSQTFLPILLATQAKLHINSQNPYLDTPLAVAVLSDDFEAAKVLLEHNADVHIRTELGSPVLQLAVRRRNMNMVDLILSYGGDLDTIGLLDDVNSPQSPADVLDLSTPDDDAYHEGGNLEPESGWIFIVDQSCHD